MKSEEAREQVLQWLGRELLGPADSQEELQESPVSRYLCGMLAPYGTAISADQNEDSEVAESDEEDEDSGVDAPLGQAMNPSSIGLSFMTDGSPEEMQVVVEWGRYSKPTEEEKTAGKAGAKAKWKRQPMRWEEPLDLGRVAPRGSRECPHAPGVSIEWLVQKQQDVHAVSLFLVNRQKAGQDGRNEEFWVFQPVIEVTGRKPDAKPFFAKPLGVHSGTDADTASGALLYRNRLEFATGHGVSVDWDGADPGLKRAARVRTVFIPSMELPNLVATSAADGADLSMLSLAECGNPTLLDGMIGPLLKGYDDWIAANERRIAGLPTELKSTASDNLNGCRETAARMKAGLQLLQRDPRAFESFRFANRAMLLQRSHTVWAADYRRTGARAGTAPELQGTWRPFQMAFILLNLNGIVDTSHPERSVADLLWFPTGGGKTEAYLGLTAFTLAYRRLRGKIGEMKGEAGIAAVMRYTLRMLTVQQFQRASTLICACETLRRKDSLDLGSEPFRIGLWVGRATTPNNYPDSKAAVSDLQKNIPVRHGNPMQVTSCSWCGEKLTPRCWKADDSRERTLVGCPNPDCEFSFAKSEGEGLPVVVVDDEIYRVLPALLIGTVDKFARMPWVGRSQSLFGIVDRYCPAHGYITPSDTRHPARHSKGRGRPVHCYSHERLLPPDLIIQDELHLISGPLGTLVALYETAVEWLSSYDVDGRTVRPKVIASTATIRRAAEQVKSLFNKDMRVFPPPMLDVEDSYFSREQPLDQQRGRIYVGVSAPGKSMKTALVRVYGLLLTVAEFLHRTDHVAADPYMTLVGYFNSLRELGGALRLVEDDVRSRLGVLARRSNMTPPRYITEPRELTSRVDSTQIPELLRVLEQPFGPARTRPYPVDVLLASNMISVGVDIDRLGQMVVAGQPKTTSEYIQATSRVGRKFPGIIVTVYKWSRPRDLSHYERFRAYHAAVYRYVEAISVTPFSSRARDRALHGILIAMSRLSIPALSDDLGAGNFSKDDPQVKEAVEAILKRVGDIEQGRPEMVARVRGEIDALMDRWAMVAGTTNLRYAWQSPYRAADPRDTMLMRPSESGDDGIWATPSSLREVEPGAHVYIIQENRR